MEKLFHTYMINIVDLVEVNPEEVTVVGKFVFPHACSGLSDNAEVNIKEMKDNTAMAKAYF